VRQTRDRSERICRFVTILGDVIRARSLTRHGLAVPNPGPWQITGQRVH
jgi:hypothetical protein